MQAFTLPDFSLPYPARINPHLERTRAHSDRWAKDMGMLDSPTPDGGLVWNADQLSEMDCPLMCTYTHPDCDGHANDLPRVFEDLSLGDAARQALAAHADHLKDWMSGILESHRRSVRYQQPERDRAPGVGFSFLPTGPGTSALTVGAPR